MNGFVAKQYFICECIFCDYWANLTKLFCNFFYLSMQMAGLEPLSPI
jgi:hypothetical protein